MKKYFTDNDKICNCVVSKALESVWLTDRLIDAHFFLSDNEMIGLHKIAIFAFFPKYRSILLKKASNDIVDISLKYSNKEGLKIVIEYIYSSKVEINTVNCINIFIAAIELGIIPLITLINNYIDECIASFSSDIEITNNFAKALFLIKNLMKKINDNENGETMNLESFKDLYSKLAKYVTANFYLLLSSTEFVKLDATLLLDLVGNYEITIENELSLFKGLINWLQKDLDSRSEYQDELLNLVFYDKISIVTLTLYVENEDFIKRNEKLNEKIKSIMR